MLQRDAEPRHDPPPFTDDDFPPGLSKERPKKQRANGATKELPKDRPQGESVFALTERDIPEPVRLCDPWATEGVNIVAGRPKLGKTTLMRQKLASAAAGGQFLDSEFHQAVSCAFLCLEEGQALARMKFKMAGFPDEALASIEIFFEWDRGDLGVKMLEAYIVEKPHVRYVCIDSLSRFRVVPDVRTPAFQADYEAISLLQEMCKRHPGVCVDVVHHTRKAKSEDPIDDISGTYGLTAAADSYMVMRHHGDGAMMHVGGRLWTREESQYLLKRDNGRWAMLGANLGLSDEQMQTLDFVKKCGDLGTSGTALAQQLGITTQSAWQRLDILLEKGFVTKKFGKVYSKH